MAKFAEIDAAFGSLLARLSGTDSLVIATADHGFLDCPPEDCLELPAALASQLRFPLCGERRVVVLPRAFGKGICFKRQETGLGERAEVQAEPRSWSRKAGSAAARRTR